MHAAAKELEQRLNQESPVEVKRSTARRVQWQQQKGRRRDLPEDFDAR